MNSTDRQRADWSCDNVAKDCFPATLGFPPGRSNDGEGSMPDPMIIIAIVKASGGLLQEVLKLAGRNSSPGEHAKKVVEKTYENVANEVTTNSLRVLLILKEIGSNQSPGQIRGKVATLAERQEPDGDRYEDDLTYRLKLLSLLGLLQPVGGSEFALTRLGVAFVDKARNDNVRYQSAFRVQ